MLQKLVLAIGVVVAFSSCHSTSYHSDEPIVEVPFTEVHVTDHLGTPYRGEPDCLYPFRFQAV